MVPGDSSSDWVTAVWFSKLHASLASCCCFVVHFRPTKAGPDGGVNVQYVQKRVCFQWSSWLYSAVTRDGDSVFISYLVLKSVLPEHERLFCKLGLSDSPGGSTCKPIKIRFTFPQPGLIWELVHVVPRLYTCVEVFAFRYGDNGGLRVSTAVFPGIRTRLLIEKLEQGLPLFVF